MTCRVDTVPLISSRCIVSAYSGHGVLGSAIPSAGTHGPALLYQHIALPADASNEFRWVPSVTPSSGTLDLGEDSGYTLTGAANGTYSLNGVWYKNGASQGASNNTITIGTGGDTTPPVITGPSGATGSTSSISIPENTTAVYTFAANEAVTWSLNGGADLSFFTINSASGALSFLVAPDFESPADSGANNTYVVGIRATDSASNATTQTLTVTVTDVAVESAPNITSQPASQTVVAPNTATFSVSVIGSGLSYQWQRNGVNIGGATSSVYTTGATSVTGGSHNNGDAYRCVVTNTAGTATSNIATLTVSATPIPVTFNGSVPAITGFVGAPISVSVASYFTGTYTPFSYALLAGSLPAGLALVNGVITGTPSAVGSTSGIRVRATDSIVNAADTNAFSISISAQIIPLMQVAPIPALSARVGEPFSIDLSTYFIGSLTPFIYTVVGGRLPEGLTLAGSVISGTPTSSENHITTPLQIAVTDAGSA
jgi:hypothetical protein